MNYLKPSLRPKIINLTPPLNNLKPKFSIGNIFISKKSLYNLSLTKDFENFKTNIDLTKNDKFVRLLKKIVNVEIIQNKVQYLLENSTSFMTEDVLMMNYIYHIGNNAWNYITGKDKDKTPKRKYKKRKKTKKSKNK